MALTQVQPGMLTGNNPAIPTTTTVGVQALNVNSGASNTAVGYQAGYTQTTAAENTFVGRSSGYSTTTGVTNVGIGAYAGYSLTTGLQNTFVGPVSGYYFTTGSNNSVLGGFNGNQGGLDIRTSSNNIVLSDGAGNPRWRADSTGQEYTLIVGVGLYAAYGCRAWLSYNMNSQSIIASGGVSSVTYNSSGTITVNFSFTMPDTNYTVTTTSTSQNNNDINRFFMVNGSSGTPSVKTTTAIQMVSGYGSNPGNDCRFVGMAIFR